MIRMIASDIDGTLLQGEKKQLSARQMELIGACLDKGILFVAASGRQYPNLKRLFAPLRRRIYYIAENGSVIARGNELLETRLFPGQLAGELIAELSAREDCATVISTVNSLFLTDTDRTLADYLIYTMRNTVTVVEDLAALDEDIINISACTDAARVQALCRELAPKWEAHFEVAPAGGGWLDFTLSNKGAAIRYLQQRAGISREETLVFGDNFNDLGMFASAERSYAMEGAALAVRESATGCCASVESVLEALL
ncbi:MAG: HAD-IIB family hydrolase [Oscillospiraceae bacterium]